MSELDDLLNDLTEAMLAREDSCHPCTPSYQRDKAVIQWHTAVEAIARALTTTTTEARDA